MNDIEVGAWVVPQPTHEVAGLDWQITGVVGGAVVLRWTDRAYRDVFRHRVERTDGFWDRYQLCEQN